MYRSKKGKWPNLLFGKENSNKEKFPISNTHVFNLFVMEKKGKEKVWVLPPQSPQNKKLNRKWSFFKKEIIKVVLFFNAPLSLT